MIITTGIWLWIMGSVIALVGWEWKKMAQLREEFAAVKKEMAILHAEHAKLLTGNSIENTAVLRDLTHAVERLYDSMDDLAHYIRWLGEAVTNTKPPPPISRKTRS